MDELELEVTKAGDSFADAFLQEASLITGLSVDICQALFKAGWTLEVDRAQPTKWVQTGPQIN